MKQFAVLLFACLLFCLAVFPSVSCRAQPASATRRPQPALRSWRNRHTGSTHTLPPVIGGRPATFYLASPKVSPLAKALYRGRFQPTDNDSTTRLLALVTTNDSVIRPFYRWCLDFTITLSDGALGEYPGAPALAYATKFPREFFAYMDKDLSGQRYQAWVEIIAYSGLNTDAESPAALKKKLVANLTSNCRRCPAATSRRLHKLANDIIAVAVRNGQPATPAR